MKPQYKKTVYACFTGYIVQAIVNNFIPLLFLNFHNTWRISMSHITLLITFNFVVQLLVDLLSAGFVDKIGYRASMVLAHACAATGLAGLAFLPDILPSPFAGLLISVLLYGAGGGLLEVMLSTIVEALPSDNKEAARSLLHSFYCGGHVGVVLLSTLFFTLFGIEHWRILALLWALIPAGNLIAFTRVPLCALLSGEEKGYTLPELFRQPVFWVMFLLMFCAGASEQAVSQWASAFAEQGLKVSKTQGDLMGPMFFAILMGASRVLYGRYGAKIALKKAMLASSALCILSYLMISLSPLPLPSLLACGICGFSVGILWPGTFSIASAALKRGGTLLFALLALAGDIGCSGGPTYVGMIAGGFGDNFKIGILAAVIFPVLMLVGVFVMSIQRKLAAKK